MSGGLTGRVMALDVGEKWIGVALSDPLGILANPLTRVSATPEETAIQTIGHLIDEHQVKLVVIGMPYSMNGSQGRQALLVEAFLVKLGQSLRVPVQTWDERLSTIAARSRIRAASGRASEKEQIDAAAAAYILEGYLERQRSEKYNTEDQTGDQS